MKLTDEQRAATIAAEMEWVRSGANTPFSGAMFAAGIAYAQADLNLALDLPETLFSAVENGPPCYENPDDCEGFLGAAVRLDDETFRKCADLLNRTRPVPPAPEEEK